MENYKNGTINSKSIFQEALYRFYLGDSFNLGETDDTGEHITQFQYTPDYIFPSMYISRVKDYIICQAFNPGQAGEYPHGGLYEISENQIRKVEGATELISKIDSKLEKIFGSKCYSIIPYSQIELVDSQIQITLPIYREEDPPCCSSGFYKFTTSDFWSYESLYYAYKKDDDQTLKWIKL
jgi:hypothetical protein